MCEVFICMNISNYHVLYNKTDILLLADEFETWDTTLKKTKIELELLTNYDQHVFIERGSRT